MRVTSSMYYENLYGTNNSKIQSKFFDVNKQIASGLSIQYASDDVATFSQTMRLDNEITVLQQIKSSTDNGYKISNQTDIVLNEFETSVTKMRTLMISASNGTNDETSMDAIAAELRGIEEHLVSLANTSINGQFLFSGSATNVKPISEDGTYNGNDITLHSFLGSNKEQAYNLSGTELFLGEETAVKRKVTTNIINPNLISKYKILQTSTNTDGVKALSASSTIRELMGDTDNSTATSNQHFFYVRGVESDGTAFNSKIEMQDRNKIEDLLDKIGSAYGNTSNVQSVNVTINSYGQIEVEDKLNGSSKLDFHIVGAVDFSGGGKADVLKISDLDDGETNFDEIINPTVTPQLYVKEFVRSPFASANSDIQNIDALLYDQTQFTKNGSKLSSNVSQIVKGTNEFASASSKLRDVADLSQTNVNTLDGTSFNFTGSSISGRNFDVQFDMKSSVNGGSTFSVDGTAYTIFDMGTPRSATDSDDMTYQQLMNVVNMVMTDALPADDTVESFDKAITTASFLGETVLSDDGKLSFDELNAIGDTRATLSMYDSNSGDFSKPASVLSFNSNNALTISDAKTDFFKTIDDVISSVENYKTIANANVIGGDMRNIGMEHSIQSLDNIYDHILKSHSKVGAQSNSLSASLERTELLEISTMTLRSSVVDTDLAKASLELTQITLNYEAMLSTVGKVSKLSLLNYL